MVHLELPDEKMGFSDGKGEMFTVSSGGEILWSRQASFRIACKMNLEKLPFDTQSCGLLAGLYSQRAEQVQLRWQDPAKYEAKSEISQTLKVVADNKTYRGKLFGESKSICIKLMLS